MLQKDVVRLFNLWVLISVCVTWHRDMRDTCGRHRDTRASRISVSPSVLAAARESPENGNGNVCPWGLQACTNKSMN